MYIANPYALAYIHQRVSGVWCLLHSPDTGDCSLGLLEYTVLIESIHQYIEIHLLCIILFTSDKREVIVIYLQVTTTKVAA